MVAAAGCGSAALDQNEEPAPKDKQTNVATDKEWSGQMAAQPEELFEGRFPGVQVLRLPEGIAVRIRGSSSVMGDQEPLYVLDGITIDPGPGGALVGINPADIERIEVLKDISSTSLYGVRGANGVILIRTRRAR
jgi:TonB-dependent SusC/RagA subfamily outer membrane receptor